ncbi:type II secretion system F family protein [Sanguibacter sp. 25GB23B1]|uniref:type II secretion system F family protein n=1 Tax=unclassified Sanguibacter TaxID=2645534 RepID=UPI0032B019DA
MSGVLVDATSAGVIETGVLVAVLVHLGLLPWSSARRWAVRRSSLRCHRWYRWRTVRGADPDEEPVRVELTVVLDLLSSALGSGAGLPRALEATGDALGGPDRAVLRGAASALLLGASWDAAWAGTGERFAHVAEALQPAWVHGAAPRDALRLAGVRIDQDARTRARTAAARLGVHLVLPLGVCFLPAFVLIGLVPVLLSLGAGVLGP